jgi:aerobic-type carbon monoxide dehydrogenase small subunit (CoxS/CutS family)
MRRRVSPEAALTADASIRIRFEVNGTGHDLDVDPARRLIDLLRQDLDMTGTKESCAVGVCGACSVLVDGELLSACLLPAVLVDGRSITTIEGIGGANGELSALQEAFIVEGGLQCGACTPGQVVAATALLRERPAATDDEVRDWMAGNLCRCTGYAGILRAIRSAAGPADGTHDDATTATATRP